MKQFVMKVRRRTDEVMLFTVEAEGMPQAHKAAKSAALAGKHKAQSTEVTATIMTCHGK